MAARSIILLFLPITLFGLLLSVNKYREQGITGAVDCNGPLSVMTLMAPALMIYTAGAIYFAILLKKQKQRPLATGLIVLCLVMMIASGRKARAAYREQSRPVYQETCGKGW